MTSLKKSVFLGLFLLTLTPVSLFGQAGRSSYPARNGIVVSGHYLGSQAGSDILQRGGNAIDAAVATAFALAVVLPAAGNIGGGGFIVYYGADGETTTFNFREKAPLAATVDMYLGEDGRIKNNSNHAGLLSVGVPGTVAGLWLAHQRLGRLPWADLLEPAIILAEKGFEFSWAFQSISRQVRRMAGEDPLYQPTADMMLKNGETPYEPGEIWKQPDLAESLKRIRDHGKDGFYKGETARLIAKLMRENGGLITEEDLARYEAEELEPIRGTYRGYDIISMPPPSSGGIALVEMLNILEGFELSAIGHNSAQYLHVLTEAMRRAYADRAEFIGDPHFNPDMPVERLTSKEHADELRSTIDLFKASPSDSSRFAAVYAFTESEETTHFSVVDAEGSAVSLTYTLEFGYGSKIVVDGAGFILNNEMGDFNAIPGYTNSTGTIGTDPNLVAPGKHMLSSMTPTIVAKDGKPVFVTGTPGGRTIINTVLQTILNVIDHGMTAGQAVEAPRIHHQWLPDRTSFESWGISADTRRLYEMMGHTVSPRGGQGAAMAIYIDLRTGIRYGAADSRGFDSRAVGY
ncbi:MAG: gamma-glutamyltransferase [Bacteroidetes bacterium]|nr:gamma-glutamyltransferase [Bacteroidota bacterium]